jgi:hypothetical protein
MADAAGWTSRDHAAKIASNLATLGSYVPVGRGVAAPFAARAAANVAFIAGLVAATAFLAGAAPAVERRAFRDRLAPWWPVLLAGALFVVVHTLRAVDMRSWYFASLAPVVLIVLALAADFIARELATRPPLVRRLVPGSALVALLLMLAVGWRTDLAERCGEIAGYAAIRAAPALANPGRAPGWPGSRGGSWRRARGRQGDDAVEDLGGDDLPAPAEAQVLGDAFGLAVHLPGVDDRQLADL